MIALKDMAGFGPPGLSGGGASGGAYQGDTVVCPLCLAHHDEMATLECGHKFCKRCLSQRTDGNMLKCPSCFKLMDLHDQGLEGLQSAYLISNILSNLLSAPDDLQVDLTTKASHPIPSFWSSKSQSTSPTCLLCRKDSATNYCVSCKLYTCSKCTSSHQAAGIAKDQHHQIVSLLSTSSEAAQPIDPSQAPQQLSYCSQHHNEILDFCCKQCIQAVCRECIRQEHINHTIVRISESGDQFRQLIPTIVQDLKSKGAGIDNIIAQVDHVMESVEKRAQNACTEVQSCTRANIKALEDKERELLGQVESIRKLKGELLRNQKDELELVRRRIINAASLVLNAYESRHDSELVNIWQCLRQTISQIQSDMSLLTMCHEDDQLDFVLRESPPSAKAAISQIGTVTSGLSSLHTTVSGHGIYCAIVGKYARFIVSCHNHCNQKINQPQEMVDVKVFGPDTAQIKVEILAKPDGILQYSYYPTTVGTYTISIQIRGRHLKESPMKVNVRKRRNYFNIGASDHQLGSDGESDGQLCRPWGICCDLIGHIIVADRSNNRVQIFNPDGSFRRKFGETGTAPGQFNRPAGVAVNTHNHIIVADKDNHRIQVFTFDGQLIHAFGERGSLNAQLHYPWDVACNADDCILVSDTRNHRIQLFSATGQYLNKFNFHSPPHQRVQLPQPRGVCFTESGDILVTDFNKHRLMFLRYNMQSIQMFGNEGQGNGQFFRPQGVAVDLEGNILVTEGRNNRVQIFRPDGAFLSKFGSLGTSASEFDRPSGICVTPDGYIVVVDFGNNRLMFF